MGPPAATRHQKERRLKEAGERYSRGPFAIAQTKLHASSSTHHRHQRITQRAYHSYTHGTSPHLSKMCGSTPSHHRVTAFCHSKLLPVRDAPGRPRRDDHIPIREEDGVVRVLVLLGREQDRHVDDAHDGVCRIEDGHRTGKVGRDRDRLQLG